MKSNGPKESTFIIAALVFYGLILVGAIALGAWAAVFKIVLASIGVPEQSVPVISGLSSYILSIPVLYYSYKISVCHFVLIKLDKEKNAKLSQSA